MNLLFLKSKPSGILLFVKVRTCRPTLAQISNALPQDRYQVSSKRKTRARTHIFYHKKQLSQKHIRRFPNINQVMMFLSKHLLVLSLLLIAAASPVAFAVQPFESYDELKYAVNKYCKGKFTDESIYG